MTIFQGSATALVTPMSADGEKISFKAVKKLLDYQLDNGTNALIVLGTTGEPATMTMEEKTSLIKFVVKYVNKKIPVIAGAGSNCTKTAIFYSKIYENLGVDGLLSVTPYYNKCTQKGLIEHYTAISKNTNLPIILYNVPSRTGVNILPETVNTLSLCPNIVGIKEASGNLEQVAEINRLCGDRIDVYSGEDGLVLPILALGGKGVISVASNIAPQMVSEMCSSFFEGNIEKSRKIQLKLKPLIKALFSEVNPIPVKAGLHLIGIGTNTLRLPLTTISKQNLKVLKKEMKELNLI